MSQMIHQQQVRTLPQRHLPILYGFVLSQRGRVLALRQSIVLPRTKILIFWQKAILW